MASPKCALLPPTFLSNPPANRATLLSTGITVNLERIATSTNSSLVLRIPVHSSASVITEQ